MHLDQHAFVGGRAVVVRDHRRLSGRGATRFAQHRVIDRVVSLKLTPYDFHGQYLTNLVDASYSFTNVFTNNVLPAYLDLELGILEPRTFEHWRALTNVSQARAQTYLEQQVARVHLFRQRVPVRTAVPVPTVP